MFVGLHADLRIEMFVVVTTFYTLDGMKSILLPKFVFFRSRLRLSLKNTNLLFYCFYYLFYKCCTSYYNMPSSLYTREPFLRLDKGFCLQSVNPSGASAPAPFTQGSRFLRLSGGVFAVRRGCLRLRIGFATLRQSLRRSRASSLYTREPIFEVEWGGCSRLDGGVCGCVRDIVRGCVRGSKCSLISICKNHATIAWFRVKQNRQEAPPKNIKS